MGLSHPAGGGLVVSEDRSVCVRLAAVCAVLALAIVLALAGCASTKDRPEYQKGITLFCAPGVLKGVSGLICSDPDTMEEAIEQQGSSPKPQGYPKPGGGWMRRDTL
jgi:hypothetical protein